MSEKIYITHCSAKKNNTIKRATPDKLYTAIPLQRFVKKCKEKRVNWAIFSDKYGVVFPWEEIEWYDKHPSKVTNEVFKSLVENFVRRLSKYDEIWFYHNPGRFHPLYKKLIKEAKNKGFKVIPFTHLSEIG
ncbi:MAG: DUF6884 domain-containing protein [Chloroflexota bacterium]